MVQIPESCKEDSEAFKNNFKNICEIGKERIRRAGEKIILDNQDKENISKLDIGFKVFKIDKSNFKQWDANEENIGQHGEYLQEYILNNSETFIEDRTNEDIIFEIMLSRGIELSAKIESYKNIYCVDFGKLFICLGDSITEKTFEDILYLKNQLNSENTTVVFKDNGFENSSIKANGLKLLVDSGFEKDNIITL